MGSYSLAPIQAKIAELKAAGAPQIDPSGWEKLVADFQHAVEELKAAQADGKIGLAEALALAKDAMTLAGDLAALVNSLFVNGAKPAAAPAA
jgi:hypothetical protein